MSIKPHDASLPLPKGRAGTFRVYCCRWPQSCRDGFTLLELLTAIAILAVLGSLLFGVVQSSRRSMKQTQNVTVLRKLGQASLAYASDHNGRFPITTYDVAGTMPRYTSGIDANAGAAPRRLLSKKWTGGIGDTDYLDSPDDYYGPFTELISRARKAGEFYEVGANVYRIGYVFYTILATTDAQGREPFGYDLANDGIGRGLGKTPLYSDMIGNLVQQTGFNGNRCAVVYADGSVDSFPMDKIDAAGSTNARILVMAGLRRY